MELAELWKATEPLRGSSRTRAMRRYMARKAEVEELRRATAPLRARPGRRPGTGQRTLEAWARPGLADRISSAFHRGELDLSARVDAPDAGWPGMPELAVAARMREGGAADADVRRFLTFVAAMDRAREADRLWFAAERLWERDPWVFEPVSVAAATLTELADALRRDGVSQRHGPDTFAWRTIAESLCDEATPPTVREAIYGGTGTVARLLDALSASTAAGSYRFPFLRGPKVGPMLIRMLVLPGSASITGLEELPVAVDVQVRKVTEYLGFTATSGLDLEQARPVIQRGWSADVAAHGATGPAELDGTCAALDPALWFWGKWGCTRCEQAGRPLPISPICDECILHRDRR